MAASASPDPESSEIIETERLILRRFRPNDWRDLFEYLSQAEVVRYEPYDVYSAEECRRESLDRSHNEAFWAVCLKENGKLIGNLYFERQEPAEYLTWELGYVLNPLYHGQGYATESCRRILRYAFEQLGAHRVIARCNPRNAPSWRLLRRLGMRREGHLRKNMYLKLDEYGKPIWVDTYEYAILAEEWYVYE